MKRDELLHRVSELSSRLLDGTASAADRRELNELLNGDPEACERYLDLAEIHGALAHEHAGEDSAAAPGAPFAAFPVTSYPRRGKRISPLWPILAAAASLALLINGLALWWEIEPREVVLSDQAGIAVLSKTVDPEWEAGSVVPGEGDALAPGTIALESGLAQLEFFSGATVILEGPARLRLKSAWEVSCEEGRLRAFVPEPAQGFIIETPEFRAVDLGTEFALSVGAGGESEVHVVDGEVRLDDLEGRRLRNLTAGIGVRSRGEALEAISGGGSDFIGREQLLDLARADGASRYRDWLSTRDRLAGDPSALVLFDFEGHEPWERQLSNRVPGGPKAAVIGAQWTEGRWPGKAALEFKRITDRVRLRIPGTFDRLTMAAWVRVEGLDRWLSSILLTDEFDPGEVHWQISDQGELILGISTGDGSPNSASPPVIRPDDLGSWLHLAVTVDRSTGRVVHYLNGEPVSEDLRTNLPPLSIGNAEIGNWQPVANSHPIRSLNGRIDEFAILARTLSADEILTLYQAGLPNG